jgi:integrase
MPRRAKGPRLYLRRHAGCAPFWVIKDGGVEVSTGCSESDGARAEEALARYITNKHTPPKTTNDLKRILIADVVTVYLKEQGPRTADKGTWIAHMMGPIIDWWGGAGKTLADIRRTTCEDYVSWRTNQHVSDQTARHELKQLSAAINYYHGEYGPLPAVPVVSLPAEASRRQDYWLTRKMAADRVRAARRSKRTKHLARMILIGVYTGTRPGAILRLGWYPSVSGGWFDLESQTLHRRGTGSIETRKRQPPARIHRRLLPHLRRWKRLDEKKVEGKPPITHVVHYYGRPITTRIKRVWASIAALAGHAEVIGQYKNGTKKIRVKDGPHVCRHTCATWLMQSGVDLNEAAGYLGMTPETLWDVYGHHHADFQSDAAAGDGRKRDIGGVIRGMRQS